ncbi:MAG TPA: RNA methyltransferase [Acidimicrobiia bacterium]|nr:RNA methyltransferase [Acidimicrobiia bacterium]
MSPLGASHAEVRALRKLLRSRHEREVCREFVIEGPRVLAAALDHDVALTTVYASAAARGHEVVVRAEARGITVRELAVGVEDRIGDTVTPQGVFALAPLRRAPVDALDRATFVLVADRVSDPGNAGTLVRSAAASGAGAITLGVGSVDAYNPKVVRATAGALFVVPVVEGRSTPEVLDRLGGRGLRRIAANAHGGTPLDAMDLTGPVAIVVGHEVEGLGSLPVDDTVTIPMAPGTESLNLAMAATVLCFEAQRQRGLDEAQA